MARYRGDRGRGWCFTSHLPNLPVSFDKNIVHYCCHQLEIGEEKHTVHHQGYIEFVNPMRRGQVKKILGECHLEIRAGTREQARDYCRKEKSRAPGAKFIEFGTWRESTSRKRKLSDMLEDHTTLDQIIENSPLDYVRNYRGLHKLFNYRRSKKAKTFRHVTIQTFIGPTGCGKSRRAISENPSHYIANIGDKLWFDGYDGEECLILDDFYGNIKYGLLLRILDGLEFQLQVKCSFVWAMYTKIVITSNAEPSTWYSRGLSKALRRRLTNNWTTPVFIQMEMPDEVIRDVIDLTK